MITLIKNADIYAPEHLGCKDILIAGDRIEKIADRIEPVGIELKTIDAKGRKVTPGFIDKHVHVTGGGGEFGFESYADALHAEDLLKVGTTTVVGLLGTDGVFKELTTLYAKVKELDVKMTAWMLTGSYAYPSKTLTGRVDSDIAMIDKVVGCKLALSDDRGSFPTDLELMRLLADCWRGGMTCGKKGILHMHMGVLETGISQILDIVKANPRLLPHVSVTHCARKRELFQQCCELARMGSVLDITTGGSKFVEPFEAVALALADGVSVDSITFSSDGRGGIRHIDPVTGEETYGTGPVDSNLREFRNLVDNSVLPIEDALKLLTVNVAREYGFKGKGRIAENCDADLIIWDDNLSIGNVIARGIVRI